MSTLIHKLVANLKAGQEPRAVARVKSGWVILGDPQVLTGYSLLLPDPVVADLNALKGESRNQFLADMTALGDVLMTLTGAVRINYAMLGNSEPALHAHVFPRYADEPAELVRSHPWSYDWEHAPRFDIKLHGDLLTRIRDALNARQLTL